MALMSPESMAPKKLQDGPRVGQTGPRWPQDGLNMVPRWPQELTAIIYKIEIRFFCEALNGLLPNPNLGMG